VRQALTRFIGFGLVALVLIGIGGWFAADNAAEREAVEDARQRTITLASAVIEPEVTQALVDGDPAAIGRFDRLVRDRVLSDSVVRVKLWSRDGRIVYSDEPRLIGTTFALDDEELEVMNEGLDAVAQASELDDSENRYDAGHGPLLEVYLPVWLRTSGEPLLFETYQTRSTIAAREREVITAFGPITLGGLALLLAVLVPIAWSLARGLDRARAERESLLRHALDASTTERRRIAAHLHDGVVQSLSGSSYALSGVSEKLSAAQQPWASAVVRDIATDLRQGVLALRSLLVEIYPPSLRRAGIGPALSDLSGQLSTRGVTVRLEVDDVPELPEQIETALFRVAQEAVRNIVKHAEAGNVGISLVATDTEVQLTISDDGRGFVLPDPSRPSSATDEGHLGLALLEDALLEVHGSLAVQTAPGQGTTLTTRIPRS
jgi:signal transduction histidine kinase